MERPENRILWKYKAELMTPIGARAMMSLAYTLII
jgi:hypothetical protein